MEALAVPASQVQAKTSEAQPATATPVESVLTALANPRYQWRTVDGIAREARLSPAQIANILNTELREVIIRSAVKDKQGRTLYTTRTRYKKTRTIGNRILSALSDQVR